MAGEISLWWSPGGRLVETPTAISSTAASARARASPSTGTFGPRAPGIPASMRKAPSATTRSCAWMTCTGTCREAMPRCRLSRTWSGSRWGLSPCGSRRCSGINNTVGDYDFTMSFEVPDDPSINVPGMAIAGRWATDDDGLDILVNGVSQNQPGIIGAAPGGTTGPTSSWRVRSKWARTPSRFAYGSASCPWKTTTSACGSSSSVTGNENRGHEQAAGPVPAPGPAAAGRLGPAARDGLQDRLREGQAARRVRVQERERPGHPIVTRKHCGECKDFER